MKIVHLNKEEIDKEVSDILIKEINNNNSKIVLGLATGSSPIGVYQRLIDEFKNNNVSFKNVITFNLDEYIGLNADNTQSYRYFMNNNLFDHIDINKQNTYIPNGFVTSDEEANYYDEIILEKGGIDIQILGLGSDGHIAFNEPGTSFDSLTHIETLTEQTIIDNSRFFESVDLVPTKAITMGLKSITNAKKIILIASGKNKEWAVNELINGNVSIALPCSILKMHKDVTIYVDKAINLKEPY